MAGEVKEIANAKGNQAIVNDGMQKFFEAFTDKNITKISIDGSKANYHTASTYVPSRNNFLNGHFTNSGLLGLGIVGQSGFYGNSFVLAGWLS